MLKFFLVVLGVVLVFYFVSFVYPSLKYKSGDYSAKEVVKVHDWPEHYDGEHYYHPGVEILKKRSSFWRWILTRKVGEWPEYSDGIKKDVPPLRVEGEELRVCHINHASLLVQTQGLNILFDPVYSERASPVSFLGPKRVFPPGIAFEDLPEIDCILITHNHYDHMDLATLERLEAAGAKRIVTPLGNGKILRGSLKEIDIVELDWGDQVGLSEKLRLTLVPSMHWSARSYGDRNKALWGSFVISSGGSNIFLCADSGYGNGAYFREIQKLFGEFRFVALPIGAYKPEWFMSKSHMNPREALEAFKLLRGRKGLGIHYGTFRGLADDGYSDPIRDLEAAIQAEPELRDKFTIMNNGEHILID